MRNTSFGPGSSRRAGRAAALLAAMWVFGYQPASQARVNPLSVIERQVQRPNMLILLDTSTSMIFLPGDKELNYNEAGPDCDNGDKYCRTVGSQGRCYYSSGGFFGAGADEDLTSCTADVQCQQVCKTTSSGSCVAKGFCKSDLPSACKKDSDCNSGTCKGNCSHNAATACSKDSDCGGSGRTCRGLCNVDDGTLCSSDADCPPGQPCTRDATDFCVLNAASQSRIKMCKLTMQKCFNDASCTGGAGDTCGPASSRMVVAKRALNAVVQDFYKTVNIGFMTFRQNDPDGIRNYWPYARVSGSVTYETRTAYLDRAKLETGVIPSTTTPCFTVTGGPVASCAFNGVTYTRVAAPEKNSRYRINRGGYFETRDADWSATCQWECALAGEGTGLYEGSYYTWQVPIATPSSTKQVFNDYAGKLRSSGGYNWIYYDAPPSVRNVNNINGDEIQDAIAAPLQSSCSSAMGAEWDSRMVPFMDTALNLSPANAQTMARKLSLVLDKESFGGVSSSGGTPSGCALRNEGTGATHTYSAYHYLQKVKTDNAANGVACRPNFVLFLTDGVPSPQDSGDCSDPRCATSPPAADCPCKAVHSARAINQAPLGAKVYVVGFSGTVASTYGTTVLNNIARAGGSGQAYFAVNETDLYKALAAAIYDAVKGSYATSPIAVGADDADPTTPTSIVLDSRADFPSWKGHLIAYDSSTTPATLLWDAATGFDPAVDPNYWKKRNVWTSDKGTMVKVQVDPSTGAIGNAAQLRALGLGTTDAEAALIARWMLGDPSLGNPAPLGAIVNSTPTQVGKAPNPSLTYAGSSDGMLHAFHSRTQSVGGVTYQAGREAFAYIPQDMLKMIRRLYAQGGQLADPKDHLFGLANSPKVKKICISNCTAVGSEVWQTVLIMPEGFGGNDIFALDITSPFGGSGIRSAVGDPPVKLLWNTDTYVNQADATVNGQKAAFDGAMGQAISLPGFYFGKTPTRDDYRSIFASGYTEQTNGTAGLQIISAHTSKGTLLSTHSVKAMGASCAKPKVDPTEPTVLADISVARRFGNADTERIAAAYVGDTWGNLFRYVPDTDAEGNVIGTTGTVSVVDSFTCSHPLHFAPTVVQLDRHDNTKNTGNMFIAQVTNSPLDLNTDYVDASWPASQLIIRKDVAASGSAVNADASWGPSGGRIVLNANVGSQICGVWNAAGNSCTTPLPAQARPVGSPTGILRSDFQGFGLVTLWYVPDPAGCTKGETYLTIHEVDVSETVKQIHGEKVGNEPVVGAVFAAGKLMVVLASGPKAINSAKLGNVKVEFNRSGSSTTMVDRYRRIGWTELP